VTTLNAQAPVDLPPGPTPVKASPQGFLNRAWGTSGMARRRRFRDDVGSALIALAVMAGLAFIGRDQLEADVRGLIDGQPVTSAQSAQPVRMFSPQPDQHFRNCDQAHAAGRYNIRISDPSYRSRMDGDGDGIACEPPR